MLSSASNSYGSSDTSCFDVDICPDLLLAGIAAFAAGAFFFLYQAITMAGKRKRRKRDVAAEEGLEADLADVFALGGFWCT